MTDHPFETTSQGAPHVHAERRQAAAAPQPAQRPRQSAGHIHGVKATSGGLIQATLGSMAAALAILVLFWLPAEYGVDPTGLSRVMGLTQMGEIKQQLYAEAADEDAVLAAQAAAERVSADPALLARLDRMESQIAGIAAVIGTEPPPLGAPLDPAPVPAPPAAPAEVAPAPAVVASAPETALPQWRDEVSYTLAPTEGIEIKLAMSEGARAEFEWTANGAVLNFDTHGDGGGRSVTYEQGRGVPDQSGELVAAFDGNHGWFWRNRTEAPVTFTLRTRGEYSQIIAP